MMYVVINDEAQFFKNINNYKIHFFFRLQTFYIVTNYHFKTAELQIQPSGAKGRTSKRHFYW